MTEEELNIAFDNAYERACNTKIQLPPDIMLHFYAYYKRATHTEGFFTPSGDSELRNAFKLNAFFQAKNLTPKEAKEKYIELVNKYIID
ncbi:acyl-CoA-binding protein [Aquimarina sp. EL_43]|uniref:acyl-CoA-binding protein n=1 Tax=Aquimarina TaxID=290174 RepID=UPI0004716943|nr:MULTISPECIES: acyl-CoA-binding protein [Aquimarina]MBG6130920.1 acyl-CoA-binding protein [Aquimarina sp. EL_35]MBG6151379.1 acyl-CoA-binding protein [Aquimarina sp. EL_32]MBG6169310.1 acyl-CoA-binding protein [Aquimarina sp. EL_43]